MDSNITPVSGRLYIKTTVFQHWDGEGKSFSYRKMPSWCPRPPSMPPLCCHCKWHEAPSQYPHLSSNDSRASGSVRTCERCRAGCPWSIRDNMTDIVPSWGTGFNIYNFAQETEYINSHHHRFWQTQWTSLQFCIRCFWGFHSPWAWRWMTLLLPTHNQSRDERSLLCSLQCLHACVGTIHGFQ